MPKRCEKCKKEFSVWVNIDGRKRNLNHRKYCLDCSPFGRHNTKNLCCNIGGEKKDIKEKICPQCKKNKKIGDFYGKKYKAGWCKECFIRLRKQRIKDRKRSVINLMGGGCSICGYDKCLSAIEIHHLDPCKKEYSWNEMHSLRWKTILTEIKKCILVCSNCHREIHSSKESFFLDKFERDNIVLNLKPNKIKKTGKCPTCKSNVYNTKYCSIECYRIGSRKVKNRPSKNKLEHLMSKESMESIGEKYGVSGVSIKKWLKNTG